MSDREAVRGFEIIDVVVQVKGLLCHILIGVVELDSEAKRTMLLDSGAHEQTPYVDLVWKSCERFTNETR